MAIRTWNAKLEYFCGKLQIVGDAKVRMQDVIARRARNPRLNLLVAEIQLDLSHTPHDIIAEHIWSEKNWICDELSRLSEGRKTPQAVSHACQWQQAVRAFPILDDEFNWQTEF